MPTDDKDATRPEGEEAPDKHSSAAVEELHIPDYVMLDFGFPEGSRVPAGTARLNSMP